MLAPTTVPRNGLIAAAGIGNRPEGHAGLIIDHVRNRRAQSAAALRKQRSELAQTLNKYSCGKQIAEGSSGAYDDGPGWFSPAREFWGLGRTHQ